MRKERRQITPKQLIEATDWWCICKHVYENGEDKKEIDYEEKPVTCFALCDVWEPDINHLEGGYKSVEILPALSNECGGIQNGIIPFNYDYDNVGNIVDLYKGRGNYKNKDIKLTTFGLDY